MGAVLTLTGCDRIGSWWHSAKSVQKGEFVKEVPANTDKDKVSMLLPDFTAMVAKEGPAVVNIQATAAESGEEAQAGVHGDGSDPFDQFFRRLVPPGDNALPRDDMVNYGSGFIISENGYILTNAHVIKDSRLIKATLNDKRIFTAKLIGVDEQTDVALLKIDADNLPTVKIGSPRALKVGEWVAAIGAPFGFDNTVTAGIVSAKNRTLPDENYTPFIQTDTAINPGNSGGPLFNLNGEVIGINSQIYSRSGGFMGISFAIPIDIAMNVAEQLKANGKVSRGQLGVIIQEVSYDLAKSFNMDKPAGALIVKVLPEGPAAQAKLLPGDIVLSVNGQAVENSSDLPMLIGQMQPGQTVKLGIWRQGKAVDINAVLSPINSGARAAAQPGNTQPMPPREGQFTLSDIGLTLSPLPPEQLKSLGLDNGLLVQQVQGKAKDAGMLPGDILMSVGQKAVNDENSCRQALAGSSGPIAPVYVMRRGQTVFLPLSLK